MEKQTPGTLSHRACGFLEDRIQGLLENNRTSFSAWTLLIMEIEETSPDDIAAVSRVYETFLSEFPLCYGYWEKYAIHKVRLCSIDKVIEVYEEAVKAATYSVDLWTNYCSFGVKYYQDLDDVRRLYERAFASVAKDYNCYILWDKCIAFEHSHKQLHHLVYIYIRSLRFPTKRLHSYYRSFRELVAIWDEEMKCQNIAMEPLEAAVIYELVEKITSNDCKFGNLVHDLFDQKPETLEKILTIGEYFYQTSTSIYDKIHYFESRILRRYFHTKPVDEYQRQIWHQYLDFVEKQGDLDWTVKLYERCLIPCANYPEFWVRYIEVMEAQGGREIANLALARASKNFLKGNPLFHLYCSKVKEQVGDIHGSRASLLECDIHLSSSLVNHINQQANMEKRLGNIGAAYLIYEKAIEVVKEQDIQAFSVLYVHFARFTYVVTGDLGATREVFAKGISKAPHCKSLFKELITFMTLHGGSAQVGAVDSIVEHAIVPEPGVPMALSPGDQEDVSNLFLEFVDLCGTVCEIRKAWARHIKLFPPAMRPSTSFSCNIDGIGMPENTKENGAQDNVHKNDIGNSDKQLLLEDSESSRKIHGLLHDGSPSLPAKSHSEVASNCTNGNLEQIKPLKNTKKLPECEANELPEDTTELLHEAQRFSPRMQEPSGCPEAEHQSQPLPDCESHDDLRPSLENLCIGHRDDETHKSCDDNAIPSTSIESGHDYKENNIEAARQSNNSDRKSVMPATLQAPVDIKSEVICTEQNLKQTDVNNLSQKQSPMQEPISPINPPSPSNSHLVHYNGQVFEHQLDCRGHVQHPQWQVPVQIQYPHSGFNSQVTAAQPYACQSQLWHGNTQVANQHHCQYQITTTPVYPAGTIVWQNPNVQPNIVTGDQSQLVNQMVTHVYQHPLQINVQQGHRQDGHSVSTQFLNYYQQQLPHMQQQPAYGVQLPNPQQQQLQSEQHRPQLQQWQLQNQQIQGRQVQQQLRCHPQPGQSNMIHEPLSLQDLSLTRQNQEYIQHQSQKHPLLQKQQDPTLPKHHEQH